MAIKNRQKQESDNKPTETWRKPLQVPPRKDAMRAFYEGGKEEPPEKIELDERQTAPLKKRQSGKAKKKPESKSIPKELGTKTAHTVAESEAKTTVSTETVSNSKAEPSNKLTEEELSQQLGFDADDLFDIRELLRGKSLEIYQNLLQECGESGRCKITQPELMNRTGIKNRRTFYKHEERLINLRLIEKRHFPGDHSGVVYSVFAISEVLPVSSELIEQFEASLGESS